MTLSASTGIAFRTTLKWIVRRRDIARGHAHPPPTAEMTAARGDFESCPTQASAKSRLDRRLVTTPKLRVRPDGCAA